MRGDHVADLARELGLVAVQAQVHREQGAARSPEVSFGLSTQLVLERVHRGALESIRAIAETLHKAGADFMPPQERDMIDFMEMLAVSETSRRSLLPERFRTMPLEEIQSKLRDARSRALGR